MLKKILLGLLGLVLLVVVGGAAFLYFAGGEVEKKVLVFSKTEGFRHSSIEAGIAAIEQLGAANGFTVVATEDASVFNEDYLKDFHVITFLNTTGDVLDPVQQVQMERFIQAGGGFVGVHSATDTEYGWPWYGKLAGAYFESHPLNPNVQEAEVSVVTTAHQSTDSLPAAWTTADEWYNYKAINPDNRVLMTVDETTYTEGTNGPNHPIAWFKDFDGGRSFYTGMGHTPEQFEDPLFLRHLLGGIRYAIGTGQPIDYTRAYAEVLPEENRFRRTTFSKYLDEPMEMDFAGPEEILYVSRKGQLHRVDLEMESDEIVATLDVHTGHEDGLLGLAVDPDYANNNWIYLYYSPAGDEPKQHLSRFVYRDGELDEASEKVLLEVATQRDECCHSGGSLEFGPDGNLFVSVGDNTNPHGPSAGFAPLDEQPGRAPWDAQKSAANTNDLRGKILRIRPEADGSYSIPEGNLFPEGTDKGRPEIYVMGNRNPFRISIDSRTGYLYWGEVGPDARADSTTLGPKGYDEINQARAAGNFGWPYQIADNKAYHEKDYATDQAGMAYSLTTPINDSPNNTGRRELPPAQPAMIYYPYDQSEEFPALGSGSRNAMAGPVFHRADYAAGAHVWPEYFDGKLLIYDWMRGWIFAVTLDAEGNYEKMSRILPNTKLNNVIDMAFGPDGALYILEYGSGWFSANPDAALSRLEYVEGNRAPLAEIGADKQVGATPLAVRFNSSNSIDYDGDALTYAWDFGDGSPASDQPSPQHTYTEAGTYKVSLTVTDSEGNEASDRFEVVAGNDMPELAWRIEGGNGSFYWANEPLSIRYAVDVSDTEDGSLAAGTLDASRVKVNFQYQEDGAGAAGGEEDPYANIGKTLVGESDCKSCHKVAAKSVGPDYVSVANRYAGQADAVDYLSGKIISGGGGVWGENVMAAHPDVTPGQAEQMVKYILSLATKGDKNAKQYAAQGTFKSSDHLKSGSKGAYVLEASYTDAGGADAPALTARQRYVLRYPQLQVEDYDDGIAMKMNLKAGQVPGIEEDMGIVIGVKDGYFVFKDLDLTGVAAVRGPLGFAPGITKGGTLELRAGGPDGTLLVSAELNPGLTTVGFAEETFRFQEQVSGRHDVYVRFLSEETDGEIVVVVLDWLEFMNEAGVK